MSDRDIVIRVGLCKKVGQPNYGSFGANMDMEIGVDLGVLGDPDRLGSLVRTAYQQCADYIEEQLRAGTASKSVPAQSVHVPTPAPQPAPIAIQAPARQSAFGGWLKGQAEAYGIPLPILTGSLYRVVFAEGTDTEYASQGKAMAKVWSDLGDSGQASFEAWLSQAFEELDAGAA